MLGNGLGAGGPGQYPGQVDDANAGGRAVAVGQWLGRRITDLGDADDGQAGQGTALGVLSPLGLGADDSTADLTGDEGRFELEGVAAGNRGIYLLRGRGVVQTQLGEDRRAVAEGRVQLDVAAVAGGDDPGHQQVVSGHGAGVEGGSRRPGGRAGRSAGQPRRGGRRPPRPGFGQCASATVHWPPGR